MVGLRRSRRRIVRFAPGMSTDAESLCLLLRPSRWYVVRASGDGRGKSNLARVPSRRPRPTWPGLSETRNGRRTSPNLGDSAGSCRSMEDSHRDSQPTTHVAGSLRDPEWASNSALPRQLLSTSNRYPDPRGAFQSGGMGQLECESRRDLPTWLGLSETENGIGTTPHAGHSYRYRTRIETCRKLLNPAEWNGPNASLGETRPRGPVSPRPGMGLEQRRAPATPLDREPSLPRIPTRLPRRSGPGWTSLLEFRSRRAARTYKAPERFRGVLFLKLFLKRRLTCPTSVY